VLEIAVQEEAGNSERGPALERFEAVRRDTESLTANLTAEDQSIQSMPDVSPTKWHLGHTSWFFETFLLARFNPHYRGFDPAFAYLFNSYYEAAGPRHPRPERGLLSRPTLDIVMAYRDHVTAAMMRLLDRASEAEWAVLAPLLELGMHHEQQHQELILMDIKHVFSMNPLLPAYQAPQLQVQAAARPVAWVQFPGGLREIGHCGTGFAFDNEGPRHKIWLEPFRLATRAVTCGEYLGFIDEGGYQRPEFWLSDGWATVRERGWEAPLYWLRDGEEWSVFTLSGRRSLNPAEPVCHISFYEADAFARWARKRLPTEAEWEIAAQDLPISGNFADRGYLHPCAEESPDATHQLRQMYGDVWEWTSSPYVPYARFRPVEGAIGEYNGKFMCNQIVLRGGAAVTAPGHVRATYRNFFPPSARWAFAGLRLAEDVG
jgi:ergothioneine biosynthesis protein EgtB